jgi:hypothetical protein
MLYFIIPIMGHDELMESNTIYLSLFIIYLMINIIHDEGESPLCCEWVYDIMTIFILCDSFKCQIGAITKGFHIQ